jgi:hypothetical protein
LKKLALLASALMLAAACSSSRTTASPPTTTTTSSALPTKPTPITVSTTPSPVNCPNPDGGLANLCLGDLAPGTYHTKHFRPGLRYTVPEGWANMEDLEGNFLLLPPGSTLEGVNPGTSDYIGVYTSVVAPDHCMGHAAANVPFTWSALVHWIESNPRMNVKNVHAASVGGLDGIVMDLSMKSPKGDGCPGGTWVDMYVGLAPSSLVHSVTRNASARVYLLKNHDRALAIEVSDASPGGSNYKDWYSAAEPVVQAFKFG